MIKFDFVDRSVSGWLWCLLNVCSVVCAFCCSQTNNFSVPFHLFQCSSRSSETTVRKASRGCGRWFPMGIIF